MVDASYIHASADVQSRSIGAGTRIWQYVVVLPKAKIGKEVNICSHCFIENDVVVGNRVTIKSGVSLWDGLRIADDVFIGPNVSFTNDRHPRSKVHPGQFLETYIEQGASIGAGAVILPGLRIGRGAMVAAGAVVTRSVPAHALVMGVPAKVCGQAESIRPNLISTEIDIEKPGVKNLLGHITLHDLPEMRDARGGLSAGEFPQQLPFAPQRYFLIYDVPKGQPRGEHAHKRCHQFLICVKGFCEVRVDNGTQQVSCRLDKPTLGLHLPPMTWATQFGHSVDAVLLVLASEVYDPADYVRDYSDFVRLVSNNLS